MSGYSKSKFGLINLKQTKTSAKPATRLKAAVFADDDDDLDSESISKKKPAIEVNSTKIRRQDEAHIRKALEEDASAFQYDEVYENIPRGVKTEESKKLDKDRKPKYIPHLLKAAEVRNREYEARVERQQQVERQKEGDQFHDKEVFVTKAYRDKMEKIHEYEAEQKRREQIENAMDVTKQKDLSGFYRHLLNDTLIESGESSGVKVKEEPASPPHDSHTSHTRNQHSPDERSSKRPIKEEPAEARTPPKHTIYSDSSDDDVNSKAHSSRHRQKSKSPPVGLRHIKPPSSRKEITVGPDQRQYKRRRSASSSTSEDESRPKSTNHKTRSGSESDDSFTSEKVKEASRDNSHKHSGGSKHRRRRYSSSLSPSPPPVLAKSAPTKPRPRRSGSPETPEPAKDKSGKFSGKSKEKKLGGKEIIPKVEETENLFGIKKETPEERLARLYKVFAHRNDAKSIEEYRQRYLERKRIREA